MAKTTRDLGREPYWRMVVGRWRRSGLAVLAFCRSEGISEPEFYWWRRRLEQTDRQKQPTFLPVQVVADEAGQPVSRSIEIVLANGRCLRVPPGFDRDTLLTLVALLDAGRNSC